MPSRAATSLGDISSKRRIITTRRACGGSFWIAAISRRNSSRSESWPKASTAQVGLLQVLHGGDILDRDDARAADALDAEVAHDLQHIGARIGRLPRAVVREHAGIGVVHQVGGFVEVARQAPCQLQILPLVGQDL
jgi:hypothetical protein